MAMPTVRGIDHVGITMPAIDAATSFLVEAFGAQMIYESLAKDDPSKSGPDLDRDTGAAASLVMRSQRLVKIGRGSLIELFEMHAPDQRQPARGSDFGLHHLASYVGDPMWRSRGSRGPATRSRHRTGLDFARFTGP